MVRIGQAVLLTALMTLLVACAGKPGIPYDRQASSYVKRIGIAGPVFPEGASVQLAASAGASFGLIGALVDAGIQDGRENRFDKVVKAQNFDARNTFVEGLTAALAAQGYEVAFITPKRESKTDFAKTYTNVAAKPVDAYLDVVVYDYGYMSPGYSAPYRPSVRTKVRLVSARDNSVLMEDRVDFNPAYRTEKAVVVAPDPAVSFQSSDDLTGNGPQAVKALGDALTKTAVTIGGLLK